MSVDLSFHSPAPPSRNFTRVGGLLTYYTALVDIKLCESNFCGSRHSGWRLRKGVTWELSVYTWLVLFIVVDQSNHDLEEVFLSMRRISSQRIKLHPGMKELLLLVYSA